MSAHLLLFSFLHPSTCQEAVCGRPGSIWLTFWGETVYYDGGGEVRWWNNGERRKLLATLHWQEERAVSRAHKATTSDPLLQWALPSRCVQPFFKISFIFILCGCFACYMSVYHMHPCCPGRSLNFLNWNYGQLRASMWVLGTQPRSSAKAATVFKCWAISPAWYVLSLTLPHNIVIYKVHSGGL